jgi:alpha-tubulin suppressor-like RCC1 family protein
LNEFSPTPATIYLANGDDFPDVLAGSALAAKTGDPIVLVDNQLSTLPLAVGTYLKTLSGSGIQPNIIALGGTDVVSDKLLQQADNVFSGVTNISTPPSRIALGFGTAYYLDSSGHVWAWGAGDCGELGNGTAGTQLNPSSSVNPVYGSTVPVEVLNLSNIVSIAAGVYTCYALDSFGHVWAWGFGDDGRLGNGTKGTQLNTGEYPIYGSNISVQVSNLTDIVSIAAAASTGYALDTSGHVWAWGSGWGSPDGSLSSSVPIRVSTLTDIVSISTDAKGNEAFAFDSSGHVWAWGHFGSGVSTVEPIEDPNQATVPMQLPNLKNIVAIAYEGFGDKVTDTSDQLWYALDSSGQVWAWEFKGWFAQDGIQTTPVKVSTLSNIVAVVGRGEDDSFNIYNSGYALDNSGRVWAWGDGIDGIFNNDGTVVKKSTLVQVSNMSNVVEIVGNIKNSYALDSSSNVWAWGINGSGQLGNGTITNSNVPVQVLDLPK